MFCFELLISTEKASVSQPACISAWKMAASVSQFKVTGEQRLLSPSGNSEKLPGK